MQRVNRSTAVAALPSPPAGGTPGYFAQPNPTGGVPATIPGYEWFNAVQEEICSVIESAGIVLDPADGAQLKKAILTSALDAVTRYRQAALSGCSVMVEI
jgi:hypothetical protein